jgi:hypothetical protein
MTSRLYNSSASFFRLFYNLEKHKTFGTCKTHEIMLSKPLRVLQSVFQELTQNFTLKDK